MLSWQLCRINQVSILHNGALCTPATLCGDYPAQRRSHGVGCLPPRSVAGQIVITI